MRTSLLALALILPASCTAPVWAQAEAATATEVKLTSPGDEPREALRLTTEEGATDSLKLEVGLFMEMSMGGMVMQSMDLPTIRTVAATKVTAVGDDRVTYTGTIEESQIVGDTSAMMPEVVGAMGEAAKSSIGATFTQTISNRYQVLETAIQAPEGATPEVIQALESLKNSLGSVASALPEEAVGIGAQWTTTTTMAESGITQTIVTSYTLTAREGDLITLSLTQEMSAPSGPLALDGVPPGVVAELKSLKGTGAGTITMDLSRLVPEQFRISSDMTIDMKMSGMGVEQEMSQRVKTTTATPAE